MMEPTGTMEPKAPSDEPLSPAKWGSGALLSLGQLLQPRPPKTLDVEIPGRGTIRVRELKQKEREEIDEPLVKRDLDEQGNLQVTADNREYKARACAYATVNADGSQMFTDPVQGAAQINELFTGAEVSAWFEGVDELNVLTTAMAKKLGKGSGRTVTGGSSSSSGTSGAGSRANSR